MIPGQHLGIVTLRGRPLRQYAAMHGEPDHPWTLATDLAAWAEFDDKYTVAWLKQLGQDHPECLGHLPDGQAIVAQPVVGGLFQLWVDQGYETARKLLDDWWDGMTEVFIAHHAHLSRDEWLAICQQAGLRNLVHVPGATVMQ